MTTREPAAHSRGAPDPSVAGIGHFFREIDAMREIDYVSPVCGSSRLRLWWPVETGERAPAWGTPVAQQPVPAPVSNTTTCRGAPLRGFSVSAGRPVHGVCGGPPSSPTTKAVSAAARCARRARRQNGFLGHPGDRWPWSQDGERRPTMTAAVDHSWQEAGANQPMGCPAGLRGTYGTVGMGGCLRLCWHQ